MMNAHEIFIRGEAALQKQLGQDEVVALATCGRDGVNVRSVNGYYEGGCVYVVTHESTHKMRDIAENPDAALCKGLLCAKGTGVNLGNPLRQENLPLRQTLREIFVKFYSRHVNESDPQTCILQVRLKTAAVFTGDTKYLLEFETKTGEAFPFVNDLVY